MPAASMQVGIVVVGVVAACIMLGMALHQPSSELAGARAAQHKQVYQHHFCQWFSSLPRNGAWSQAIMMLYGQVEPLGILHTPTMQLKEVAP